MEKLTCKVQNNFRHCAIIISLFLGLNSSVNGFAFQQAATALQDFKVYKGLVLDNNTRNPLGYADITVNASNISIVTNREGKFSLKVPIKLLNETVSFSFLGYETIKIPLSNLKDEGNIIELNMALTELEAISINAPKSASALVKRVLSNTGDNYASERINMVAFYRETIKKGRKNASLAEAVVKVFKQPYSSTRDDAVELVKSRKSTNYSRLDTVAVKLQGGPFSALYSDIVKYPKYIFTEDTFPYYKFSFDPSTNINERQVYVVNFEQLSNIVTPLYSGKLYIDMDTFTLVRGVYHLNVENKDQAIQLFLRKKPPRVNVDPLKASYRVDYKIANGKWYYSYSNIELAFRVKWRRKLFGSTYTLNIEMAVTDWQKALVTKINPKKRLRPSVILSDKASGFSDPEFWGEYNVIEPEKSIQSAIKKIKKELSKIERKRKKKK